MTEWQTKSALVIGIMLFLSTVLFAGLYAQTHGMLQLANQKVKNLTVQLNKLKEGRAGGARITLEELKNATYVVYPYAYETTITLKNGRFEGPIPNSQSISPLSVSLDENAIAFGDIDGDGREDAAIILRIDPTEANAVINLAIMEKQNDEIMHVSTVYLGYGVVDALSIKSGKIKVDVTLDELTDGTTQRVTQTFELKDDRLQEVITWKTYRNEEYAFEVKYPKGWQIEEDYGRAASNFLLEGPSKTEGGEYFGIQILPGSEESTNFPSLDEIAMAAVKARNKVENIEVNGTRTLRISSEYNCSLVLYEKEYNKFFYLSCDDTSIRKQILSTFTFIPQKDSAKLSCQADSDCTLLLCAGAVNKEWAKTAPPDLPCARYEGYTAKCVDNMCKAVK